VKEKGNIIKKKNAIGSQLKTVQADIVKFQTLKQASLNSVEVRLTLRMNQVILLCRSGVGDVFELELSVSNSSILIFVVLCWGIMQVEYMENGQLPADLSGALVFTLSEEQGLKDRIQAHMEEKVSLKKLLKDLHKMHADLQRDRRFEEKKTKMTQQKYVESQMLKFGEVPVTCIFFSYYCTVKTLTEFSVKVIPFRNFRQHHKESPLHDY